MESAAIQQTERTEQTELEKCQAIVDQQRKEQAQAERSRDDLRRELSTEQQLRETLTESFDCAALEGRVADAQEINRDREQNAIRIRGLELQVSRAQVLVDQLRTSRQPLEVELDKLMTLEQIANERREVEGEMTALEEAYGEIESACSHFEKAILRLKQRTFLDRGNQSLANDKIFRFTSKIKGFNF